MDFKVPIELKYTNTHEWIRLKDNICIMGITDFAQHQLSDIVYVELPKIGQNFEKGKMIGEIESVKAVGEFYMPLSGEIIELNQKIMDNPELINSSPYEAGWFLKIMISTPSELDTLLLPNQYQEIIKKEENQ
jgi:glycine cleavage system H protein